MQHDLRRTILQQGQASELPETARSTWTPWTSSRPCLFVCYRSDSVAWTTIGSPRSNSASHALNQLLRRHLATTLRRTRGIGFGHQRNRAGRPARSEALCAHGRATNTTACLSRCSVVPASVQGGVPPRTSTTKLSRSDLHQRSRARHAAHGMALSRCGSAYQAPPLELFWQSVVSVSSESGVPLSPGPTMPRLADASPPTASWRGLDADKWQRGHVGPPVAALGGNPTPPLYFVRCSVGLISGHCGLPPCPGSTRLSLGVRGSVARARYVTHFVALRVYIGCCFVKWPPVAPLGAAHRFAPSRVYKTHPMQSASAGYRRTAVGAPRALSRPTRRRLATLWMLWHLGIGRALRAVFWPVACGHSSCVCPCPPLGACRFAALAPHGTARPPPKGAPSARAPPLSSPPRPNHNRKELQMKLTCNQVFQDAINARRINPPCEGIRKLEEGRHTLLGIFKEVQAIAAYKRHHGSKYLLQMCQPDEIPSWMRKMPASIAYLLGRTVLPAFGALSADGVPPAAVAELQNAASKVIKEIVAKLESAQQSLSRPIGDEYKRMKAGSSTLEEPILEALTLIESTLRTVAIFQPPR